MGNKILSIFGGEPLFKEKRFTARPVVPTMEELEPFLRDLLKSAWLTNNGKYLIEFEKILCKFLNVENCATFCNGTLALHIALKALGLKGEIITTPFTFPATIHAIHWSGLVPVFCDIEPDTFNIDAKKIKSLITPKTQAIVPVHVFGNPCDVEAIDGIASAHGLKVIYDAAHAFGVKYNNNEIGTYGDINIFSFHATKLFNTLEGGAASSKDISIDQKLRNLRNFGIISEEEVVSPGINAKMNELQAIFGLINVNKVNRTIEKRKNIFTKYHKVLSKIHGVYFQKMQEKTVYNYSYLPIRIIPEEFGLTRDEVYTCLREEGVMVRKYFWPLCSNIACYNMLKSADKTLLVNSNAVAESVLTLPLYEDLSDMDVKKILDLIVQIHKRSSDIKNLLEKRPLIPSSS